MGRRKRTSGAYERLSPGPGGVARKKEDKAMAQQGKGFSEHKSFKKSRGDVKGGPWMPI